MPATPTDSSQGELFEIHDPEINVRDLMLRIRNNMARRTELPPLPAALGMVKLAEQRNALLKSIKNLQRRIRDYGTIGSRKKGWRANLELCLKQFLRKLVLRHVMQQRRVHVRLLDILKQLAQYLEDQDRYLRTAFDLTERQQRHAAQVCLTELQRQSSVDSCKLAS